MHRRAGLAVPGLGAGGRSNATQSSGPAVRQVALLALGLLAVQLWPPPGSVRSPIPDGIETEPTSTDAFRIDVLPAQLTRPSCSDADSAWQSAGMPMPR